jgi:hypothetical protein
MKLASLLALAGSGVLFLASDAAAVIVVQSFSAPASPVAGVWYEADVRFGGTASVVDLTGAGGNLESNQPLPTGAAKLTTGFSNNDKAEVATYADYGLASNVLNTGTFGYSFYKQTVSGGNAFAAPSLKIGISAAGGTGDNYGQLVYEPNWNQPGGGSQLVPADAWQTVSIDANAGAGGDGSGGWYWTGGFELPNGAGGPPIKSLAEWAAAFTTADPDFANARIVSLAVGVGSYNQGQVGYFDNVSIDVPGGASATYDFQAIPEPTAALFGALLTTGLGATIGRRRRDEIA